MEAKGWDVKEREEKRWIVMVEICKGNRQIDGKCDGAEKGRISMVTKGRARKESTPMGT